MIIFFALLSAVLFGFGCCILYTLLKDKQVELDQRDTYISRFEAQAMVDACYDVVTPFDKGFLSQHDIAWDS